MIKLILTDIALLSAISLVLSVVMVIAEKWLRNYGDCSIDINGKRQFTVKGGNSLLSSLNEKQIYLASACGGRGTCGACKCKVISGGGPLLPTERPLLSAAEIKEGNVRLACQVKVKSAINIEIPPAIFNIRRYQASVAEIIDYTYDTKGVLFKFNEGETIDFQAGQYVQLETQAYGKIKEKVSRAYSISSKPELKDSLQLIIRYVPEGICTTWVHQHLKVGDRVIITGPYGDFYLRDTEADIIYVAGGSGKAPIKSMLEHLAETGCSRKMTYFFGARTMKDLYLTEEMQAFENIFPDFRYVPVLSAPEPGCNWTGKTGFVMPYFKEVIRDASNTEAYLCGSPGMINAVTQALLCCGIHREKIYYDSFG